MPDLLKTLVFFDDVRKKNWPKNAKILFTVCFGPASQSIGRGQLSREEALDVRESRERRDKIVPIFSPEKQEKRNFGLKFSAFVSRIACCARELTSAWHGAFVILKKRWPNKKLFLRRRACTQYYVVLSLNLSYPIGGWSTRSTTRHLELMSGPN